MFFLKIGCFASGLDGVVSAVVTGRFDLGTDAIAAAAAAGGTGISIGGAFESSSTSVLALGMDAADPAAAAATGVATGGFIG